MGILRGSSLVGAALTLKGGILMSDFSAAKGLGKTATGEELSFCSDLALSLISCALKTASFSGIKESSSLMGDLVLLDMPTVGCFSCAKDSCLESPSLLLLSAS